jgi:hypothetical protein
VAGWKSKNAFDRNDGRNMRPYSVPATAGGHRTRCGFRDGCAFCCRDRTARKRLVSFATVSTVARSLVVAPAPDVMNGLPPSRACSHRSRNALRLSPGAIRLGLVGLRGPPRPLGRDAAADHGGGLLAYLVIGLAMP